MNNHYRAAWISDIHLGFRGSRSKEVYQFIKNNKFDTLYLVGDIIDIWRLRRNMYWDQSHTDVIQQILKKARKGTHVIYIPGNHDEFVWKLIHDESGIDLGNITIAKNWIHKTSAGEKILVMHGHEFDIVTMSNKWLAILGDKCYDLLLWSNRWVNKFRRLFGRPHWSLSAYLKSKTKEVVNIVSRFEEMVVKYAEKENVDGILTGHIHSPALRKIGNINYYNDGDWVESCTAIVENNEGKLELLNFMENQNGLIAK